ncbi:MAG: XdhC family protein [Kineosporiaceae bacterium]
MGAAEGHDIYRRLAAAVRAGFPVVVATVLDGGTAGAKLLVAPGSEPLGTLGDPALDEVVARDALGELAAGTSRVRRYGPRGQAGRTDVGVFVESFAPPPRMVIFGAIDFAAALARVAKVLGYRVTVCDARGMFATPARFPVADEVVVGWPQRYLADAGTGLGPRDVVCVLTHDPKFDVPAIVAALATGVGYLGVMGSRRTHADRVVRLRAAGVDDAGMARLHAPIGLDIGARTPEETAVSICAEIIAVRSGRTSGRSLSRTDGPIHEPRATTAAVPS